MRLRLLIGLALCAATLSVFAEVRGFEFLNLDDGLYVAGNGDVRAGLTLEGVRWAATTSWTDNWHPLTWLSLMLDVELFGLNAGALHLMNLCLHAANVLLLFLLLAHLTGGVWRSAFVAALFAIHPLHVESVAWISERKDVLSTLFWLGATWAYASYVTRSSRPPYALALALMAAGLMAKPMLVTLPFALLLFDVWPLQRLEPSELLELDKLWPRVREKLPFFALSVASSSVTIAFGARMSWEELPLLARVENALVSYVRYLGKAFWPTDLSIFYPHPGAWPAWQVLGCLALLLLLTATAIRLRRRAPYAIVGWLFFLGVLVPTIGIIQVGRQALADRYTYIPLIGIFWIVAWGVPDLTSRWPRARIALAVGACAALVGLGAESHRYVSRWRGSVSIFEHALATTRDNFVAHSVLGETFLRSGDLDRATAHIDETIRLKPREAIAHQFKGAILLQRSDLDGAIASFRQALRLERSRWPAYLGLGEAFERRGDLARAVEAYRAGLAVNPRATRGWNKLGRTLAKQGRLDEAHEVFARTIRSDPNDPEAYESLAIVAEMRGDPRTAVAHYRGALERQPEFRHARRRLGWILATSPDAELRDGDEAIRHFRKACEQTGQRDPDDLDGLAAAYAEAGRFDDALRTAEQASAISRAAGRESRASLSEQRAALYARGRPLRLD
jgi:tetratricopeptide (TPR) repeat protein